MSTIRLSVLGSTPGTPVVVMVHGFLFDPKQALKPGRPRDTDNPLDRCCHYESNHAEHDEQRYHTTSWPHWLGFAEHDDGGGTGLAVAFGWQSQSGFASSLIEQFQNFYAPAYDKAEQTRFASSPKP